MSERLGAVADYRLEVVHKLLVICGQNRSCPHRKTFPVCNLGIINELSTVRKATGREEIGLVGVSQNRRPVAGEGALFLVRAFDQDEFPLGVSPIWFYHYPVLPDVT